MTDLLSVFDVLIDAVVPVACIFGIGYLSGIFRVFDKQQALTILKFVGMFGVPSISASILITTDVTAMDFDLSLSYLAVEVAVYLFAAAIARVVFAVGIAVITVVIRLYGAYPEGISFAIIIMNAFVPLINTYFKPRRFGSKIKAKIV